MSKHTPGPWFAAPHGKYKVATITQALGVYADSMPNEKSVPADARLIAAAPELCEAPQKCSAVLSGYSMDKSSLIDALESARAALSKVEGE